MGVGVGVGVGSGVGSVGLGSDGDGVGSGVVGVSPPSEEVPFVFVGGIEELPPFELPPPLPPFPPPEDETNLTLGINAVLIIFCEELETARTNCSFFDVEFFVEELFLTGGLFINPWCYHS